MKILSNKIRRCVAVAVTAALFTGLFVGCSGGSDRVLLPTPTPRTENNKVSMIPEPVDNSIGTGRIMTIYDENFLTIS